MRAADWLSIRFRIDASPEALRPRRTVVKGPLRVPVAKRCKLWPDTRVKGTHAPSA